MLRVATAAMMRAQIKIKIAVRIVSVVTGVPDSTISGSRRYPTSCSRTSTPLAYQAALLRRCFADGGETLGVVVLDAHAAGRARDAALVLQHVVRALAAVDEAPHVLRA